MAIDLLTSTGLRVSEAANLKCGDLKIGYSESKIFIHNGKGSISGHIIIHEALKKHLKQYLAFKQANREGIADEDFLFVDFKGSPFVRSVHDIDFRHLPISSVRNANEVSYKLTNCGYFITKIGRTSIFFARSLFHENGDKAERQSGSEHDTSP
jgi:site-specific recombinase XerD